MRPGNPEGGLTVSYGYVNPVYNSGAGSDSELFVDGFNYVMNDKNQYVCNITAVGAGAILEEIDAAQHIKSKNLQVKLENPEGDDETVKISSIVNLIDYDATKNHSADMVKDIDHGTKISAGGGSIFVVDEPVGGGWLARIIAKAANFLGIDPDKMIYVNLQYIVKRLLNDQILGKVKDGPFKGKKIVIDSPTGKRYAGLTSGDPAKFFMYGASVGGGRTSANYKHETKTDLGINFEDGAQKPNKAFNGNNIEAKNIYFNRDCIAAAMQDAAKAIESAQAAEPDQGRPLGEISIKAFLDRLFVAVKNGTGGWIDLHIMENPDNQNELLIHNRNYGGAAVSPVLFDPINGDGITRSCQITCAPNQADVYGLMMTNLSNKGLLAGEVNDQPDTGTVTPSLADARANLVEHMKFTLGTVGMGEAESYMTAALRAMAVAVPVARKKSQINCPFPMKLQLKLDGTSGFKFGDLISSTMLTQALRSKDVCFRVVNWTHTISNNDWTTDVEAIMDVAG